MLGPAYAIPILRKGANHELRRYVKTELNDNECHWFTCGSSRGREVDGHSRRGVSLFAKLRRPRKAPAAEAAPSLVPCAVLVTTCSEDDRGRPLQRSRQ